MNGYAGSVLYVNLTTGEIKKEPLDLDVAHSFVGGRGMGTKLGYDLIKPGIDPLSPENKVIINVGPLTGTNIPGSTEVSSVTKMPATGAIGWGSGGGFSFGCMLKHAGYDHIVIQGRAQKPVYLKVFDDDIELCDAGELWGRGLGEAAGELYNQYGTPLGVISIGQGGENLVKFAMSFIDRGVSHLGRGGLGAVLGSKNIKAVISRGTKGIGVADRKKYRELVDQLYERYKKYPVLKDAQKYGFLNISPVVSKEDYLKLKKARLACISCPIGDKELYEVKKGRFRGLIKYGSGPSSLAHKVTDCSESLKLRDCLDEYGLDRFEVHGLLKFADELYKHGMLTEGELGTPGIGEDYDSLTEWYRKIAYREGFGNVLADGCNAVLQKYGKGAEKFVPPVIKGMIAYSGMDYSGIADEPPRPPHILATGNFGMVVHPSGPKAGPGATSPTYAGPGRPADWLRGHLERMGAPEDRLERIFTPKQGMAVNMGRMTKNSQLLCMLCDSLGMCSRAVIARFQSKKLKAELYTAVTGIETSGEELMEAAERAQNLLKAANVREGFGRKDDYLPERWFGKEKYKDYYGKVEITKEIAEGLLDDYYDEMGWDVKTGIPTKGKLLELGLDYVIRDSEKMGIKYP